MAGHSKFKNIMHRKGAQDKKRGKIFNKIAREITVAVKTGLPDPETNPRLRAAITAARQANMPNERVQRAIKSGSPDGDDQANYEEIRYEGYGPAGVAVIVEALTDNRNRTAAEVRAAFSKFGGALGETNSVSFMFDRVGQILFPVAVAAEDAMFEAAVEAGADHIETSADGHEILTAIENFMAVKEVLEQKFGTAESANLIWKPQNLIAVDEEKAISLMKMIEMLEDSDDVQTVFANFEMDDAIMEKLSAA